MKDFAQVRPTPANNAERRIKAAFAKINSHRAHTLSGLTGTLIMLPMVLQAQDGGAVVLSSVSGVQNFEVLDNGSVRVTLTDGQSVIVAAVDVVSVDGEVTITEQAAQELAVLGLSEGGAAGGSLGIQAVVGGLAGLGALALGGGGDNAPTSNDDGVPTSNLVSKTLTVVDAPLEEALVFYDSNGDDRPSAVEFLGVTDADGAIDVEYEPTENGIFLIIPAPVVNPGQYSDIGWDAAFIDQIDGFVTRDVLTDNVFNQVLQANDVGADTDQVVSPISTLVTAGVPEDVVKQVFGLSAETDIDTFNFFAVLTDENSTPEQLAEAKAASAAAVATASVVSAAITAAQAQKQVAEGETQELTADEIAQVSARAIQATAEVLRAANASTNAGGNALALEDVAEIATAVAVTRQLNSDVVDDEKVTEIVADIVADVQGTGNVSDSVTDQLQALEDAGEIDGDTSSTAIQTSGAVRNGTVTVQQALEDNNPSDANFDQVFKEALDQADDDTDAAVNEIVNKELLGINLGQDVKTATEGQNELIKGNLLLNDKFSDGTALPAATQVVSVNGREVADTIVYDATGEIDYAKFMISTADYYSSWFAPGARTVSNEAIEDTINLNAELPGAAVSGFSATKGSAITGQLVVEAGDSIAFTYFFGSEDYLPWNDYSFFAVQQVDQDGNAIGAGEVLRNDSGTPGGAPLDVRDLKGSGYGTLAGQWAVRGDIYEYTFDEAGTYNFAFGVTDVGDTIFDTFAWVADINTRDAEGNDTSALVVDSVQKLGNTTGALGQSNIQVPDTVTATLLTGFYGSLIVQEDGDYLYQVGGANSEDVPAGLTVTDNFTYKVETPSGRLATQQLKVQITGVDEGDDASVVALAVSDANAATETNYVISGTIENVEPENMVITITQVGGESPASITVPAEEVNTSDDGGTVTFFTNPQDLSGLPDGPFEVRVNYVDANGDQQTVAKQADLDTTADADPAISFEAFTTPDSLAIKVDGLDADASASITVSIDGSDPVVIEIAGNGVFQTGLANAMSATVAYEIEDDAGNTASGEDALDTQGGNVLNVEQGTLYATLQEAVDAAAGGETLQLAGGHIFDEDVVIDKSLTIEGATAGQLIPNDPTGLAALDVSQEDVSLVKSLTVAAPDVRIDGVVFMTQGMVNELSLDAQTSDFSNPPLSWNAEAEGGVDGFALANSVLVGYSAAQAPSFGDVNNLGSDEQTTKNWSFTGNLIGGLTGGTGGALNLENIADLTIAENMFWRPAAGHVYLSSVSDVMIEDNFFYHGVHAGGANFDGALSDGDQGPGYGYGYGDDGYGYGYGDDGYGYGYGYGYGDDGYSGTFFGRNFWLEFKGQNADVTIQGNDGQYNSGGIQLFGEAEGASFENFVITNNTFRDFVNADPTGVLGEGRSQSGFMGAVAVSVANGSSADGIAITNNTITAALDQVYSDKDQFALVSVQGNVENVDTNANQISWVAQSSEAILAQLSSLEVAPATYVTGVEGSEGVVVGLAYVGGISGAVNIQNNTISEAMGTEGGAFYAIYLDGGGFSTQAVDFEGDMTAVITETGNTLNLSGQNALPLLATDLPPTFPLNDTVIDSDPAFGAVDLGGNGTEELYLLNTGTEGNDNLSMSASREFIVGQQGVDNIDVGGGKALIAIQFGLEGENTANIANFTAGAPSDPQSDFLPIFLANGFELRGESFQVYNPGDAIGDDSAIFQVADFDTWTTEERDAFFGAIPDEEHIVLVSNEVSLGGPTTSIVAFGGDGLNEGGGAVLQGVSAEQITAETFLLDSSDPMLATAEV
jgi:VCBS repeat-containing protein